MPPVDILAEGFLAGAMVGALVVHALHVQDRRRIERRRAFGLKRHPAFRG